MLGVIISAVIILLVVDAWRARKKRRELERSILATRVPDKVKKETGDTQKQTNSAISSYAVHEVPSIWTITDEFKQVRDLINKGEKLILVTGGAGTGKTTLIQWLLQDRVLIKGNIAVVAFTGIAALVCRGKTIHSFFYLPPATILPNTKLDNITSTRASVLASLQLLIIDEISMVRADLMDAIDRRLREARRNSEPFGGVPLLMVGDPCQLPPVVGAKERKLFSPVKGEEQFQLWASPWFFHAGVFKDRKMKQVLLTQVFRQDSAAADYLEHLDKMRRLSVTTQGQEDVINYFNGFCYKGEHELLDHAITITFTNAQADEINTKFLQELPGSEKAFVAAATGFFQGAVQEDQAFKMKANRYTPKLPAPYILSLKEGAQVMLLVNAPDKSFVNGTIATIVEIGSSDILVQLPGGREVYITKNTWESEDYWYNEEKAEIEKIIDGTYTQYPLTLAWAFTAHKSQGKTLDRVNIITSQRAFASGQTYVALSRTRRIEDMRLSSPLSSNNFVIDRDLLKLKDYISCL